MKKRLAKKKMKHQAAYAAENTKDTGVKTAAAAAKTETADIKKAEPAPETKAARVKTEKKAVKSAAKSSHPVQIFYEFSNKKVEQQEIIDRIKSWWKGQGYLLKDLKELAVYLKIEEKRAYYVINDSVTGSVAVA